MTEEKLDARETFAFLAEMRPPPQAEPSLPGGGGAPPSAEEVQSRLDAASALAKLGRTDSWQNLLTGLGNPMRDKRLGGEQWALRPSYGQLSEWYRGSDTAARVVDKPADEMTREWIEVNVGDDDKEKAKEAGEDILDALEELAGQDNVNQGLKLSRAFGGAGVVLGADDGQAMVEPLDIERIKTFDWMTTLDAYELIPDSWYVDPAHPKYGKPEVFRISPLLAGGPTYDPTPPKIKFYCPVHETRVLTFHGVITTRWQARETRGWGDSVLARVMAVVRDFETGWESAAALLQDFAQGVFAMKGLADTIAAGKSDVVRQRLAMMDICRSVLRSVIIDADKESFQRVPTPIGGLADLLSQLCNRMAAAADMPATVLMGISPAGLNATGQSDIRLWYDRLRGLQKTVLRRLLKRLLMVLFHSKNGPTGTEPKKWRLEFKPLYQLNEVENADLRLKIAQTDAVYLTNQVLTPEEVAVSRFGENGWSMETVIDRDARAKLERAQAAAPAAPGAKPPGAASPKVPEGGPTSPIPKAQPPTDQIPKDGEKPQPAEQS